MKLNSIFFCSGERKDKWPQHPVVQGPVCVRDGDGHRHPPRVGHLPQQQEEAGGVCPAEQRKQVATC